MTVIAAWSENGVVTIGADSASVSQSHYLNIVACPKVFQRDEMVFGYTSSFRMGQALQYRLEIPLPIPVIIEELDRWMAADFANSVRVAMRDCGYMKVSENRESGGVFLCGVRGQIYYCDEDFHTSRLLTRYGACGSGESAALGALFALNAAEIRLSPFEIVGLALAAAESCVTSVRGPFHFVQGGKLS